MPPNNYRDYSKKGKNYLHRQASKKNKQKWINVIALSNNIQPKLQVCRINHLINRFIESNKHVRMLHSWDNFVPLKIKINTPRKSLFWQYFAPCLILKTRDLFTHVLPNTSSGFPVKYEDDKIQQHSLFQQHPFPLREPLSPGCWSVSIDTFIILHSIRMMLSIN